MLLQPNKHWHWFFDTEQQRMTLLLGEEMQFISELASRKMSHAAWDAQEFTCSQTQNYYHLLDSLEKIDWPDPIKVQIALNALTFAEFHSPIMPQSWFFERFSESNPCHFAELILLKTKDKNVQFIVLEATPETTLCMCLENKIKLTSAKIMNRFDIIKVMNDRILKPTNSDFYAEVI
ncbi:MAG: Cell division protein ZapC [Candidatus Celerinatantimonas neptuna]|nr:MAG: Cell division protein ZapC [Candidatus Celerinatantimonas neptuna]